MSTGHETLLILDYGSQYTQLIARRVRELGVYSEILPCGIGAAALAERRPKALILSGGPDSVYRDGAPGSIARSTSSGCRSSASATACS